MSVTRVYVSQCFVQIFEAVAKSIKHATAMSTILAIELFQARRDAAIASSKMFWIILAMHIHHSCLMISTDNTTVVSYINKQGGTRSPNLCIGTLPLVPGTRCNSQNSSHSREIQNSCGPSVEIRQTSQNRMVLGSNNGKLHFFKWPDLPMWICLRLDLIKNFHCMSLQFRTIKHLR